MKKLDFIEKVDYTYLKGEESNMKEVVDVINNAKKLNIASICMEPKSDLLHYSLKNCDKKICTVFDFPNGNMNINEKAEKIEEFMYDFYYINELDIVINYKQFIYFHENVSKSFAIEYAIEEIRNVKSYLDKDIILKVIVESGYLPYTDEMLESICIACHLAGADYIKTSTGKIKEGASIRAIKIFSDTIEKLNSKMLIKASGGIKSLEFIEEILKFPLVKRLGMGYSTVDELLSKGETENNY